MVIMLLTLYSRVNKSDKKCPVGHFFDNWQIL